MENRSQSTLKPSSMKWTGCIDESDYRQCSRLSLESCVSFDSVSVQEFPMTVGDNPSAMGPPVQLDYSSTDRQNKKIELDTYERTRQPRRSLRQLRLSTRRRHMYLREERGLPQEQINEAVLKAHEIRLMRKQTSSQPWCFAKLEECTESAERKLFRLFSCELCC